MYRKFFKRFFDIVLSVIGVILTAIPMMFIAIAIKLDSPGPVIFRQDRIGRNGKVYKMYKFRSMCVGAESMAGGVYSDRQDTRVSRVGRVLRATSLDELPQFWNVLKGDMSLIGFRSPLTYHPWPWEQYTQEQRKMFTLRPGITGWAQVNGRKTVEWPDRIAMNCWCAENVSFWLDLKILFITVGKVLGNDDNENFGETVKGDKKERQLTEK